MLPAPFVTVALDRRFVGSIVLGRKVLPSSDATLIAEGKVADLAHSARCFLGMPERASDDHIRIVVGTWVAIECRPGIELALLSRNPSQDAALDATEICDQ